ncbi:MAG: zinc metalloprotease HtpX [Candidatus Buchananbacteria bacterium CG10_big_fil_rev_8_21_14_0_10_42_9]|uniref:Protease HtpX homolog n=1 Tax=Candidatus Buchananbacteria bacterium CG10_big_fil_rev_8_21_14_0_10_42_9 TaxID=1974526 RepID=A0A2H0W0V0_9BACT|nr:MAG: zinc metalloprotease HtpX [Candidatus Buchananbacteria bacterium CG10_big_fil_rev_8_21_14_0_10_42_9]
MYSQIDSNKRKSWILIALFIVFIVGLGWFFGEVMDYGNEIIVLALAISLIMSFFSYFSGDKVALATSGAKGPINKNDNAYVYRMVENLCITTGVPMPKIYIISDPAINAFATGRDPEHASVAVTTGAIDKLENEELEGVLAHELSHVKNYDIRLMMIVIVLIGIVVLFSDIMLRSFFWGGGKKSRSNQGGAILLLVGLVLAILSPIIGKLIQLAISRKREYLADASGALITRYPQGLASALKKIGQEKSKMRRANHATAHLYFANPFGGAQKFFDRAFATHPPLDERIKILENMA